MKSQEFQEFKKNINKEEFKNFYQENGFQETLSKYNLSNGNLRELIKEWNLYLTQEQKSNLSKKTWKNKETSIENQLSELTTKISKEELYKYYIEENHSQKEASEYLNVSDKWLIRLIDYYGLHKDYNKRVKLTADTKQEKYGDSSFNNREKAKETCLEKYGVDNIFKDTDKIKDAIINKYGVEHIMQVPEIKDKSVANHNYEESIRKGRETLFKNTGYSNPAQNPETQGKMQLTNIKKYGVPYPIQNKEISKSSVEHHNYEESYKKYQSTIFLKTGYTNSSQNPETKEKIKQSNLEKYGVVNPMQSKEIRKKQAQNAKNSSLEKKYYEFLKNNHFEFESQYILTKGELTHTFDFAIFKDSKLNLLIDCDGLFYHGYLTDVDGKKVNNYSDDYRSLLVPEEVKFLIILEGQEEKGFEEIYKVYDLDYAGYIQDTYEWCARIDFPYPAYTDSILNKSFDSLLNSDINKFTMNARFGEKIISHFHKSIWKANKYNKLSPYEAWQDKELLLKCIKNRIIYKGDNLAPDKILSGFSISGVAPKVSVFNPYLAKYIIGKYLNEFNTIFDPCSGYSGRLLGACSLNKKYIGQDINLETVQESKEIINRFQLDAEIKEADSTKETGTYECLFTCSPYGNKENWNQEIKDYSCDDWIDICLSNYKCETYIFVVDNTTKYKDFIIEEIHSKSHFNDTIEYIIKIEST